MEPDKVITDIAERLDTWCKEYQATLEAGNLVAQAKVLQRGAEIAKELERIKAEGLAAMTATLVRQDWRSGVERSENLMRALVLGSILSDALSDTLMDTEGHNTIVTQMNAIVDALDAMAAGGRLVLIPLLDHPNAGVRAAAGAYLITLIPDRVLPILRQVEESEHANSAHYTAYWARRRWELDGK